MKKIIFLFIIIFTLSSCSIKKNQDINSILLNIENYSAKTNIEFFSNKNSIKTTAFESYYSPNRYSIQFFDELNLSTSYSEKMLSISNEFIGIKKEFRNYPNLNSNPLFLSYFLTSYFNMPKSNITHADINEVSIILPSNNPYLHSATLKLKDNIPYSLTYFDNSKKVKLCIIYSEFKLLPS